MTESCGMCAVLPPELMQYGCVGLPMPSIEVKLIDVPDAGYSTKGKPSQGEVCIRGPSVIKGYYKRDDLNNDETIFTKDGWLRTGDVGQWNEDGTLTLIDRIKNLVKLQGGEVGTDFFLFVEPLVDLHILVYCSGAVRIDFQSVQLCA
jgi:long-chain acyl-CoA synthetase